MRVRLRYRSLRSFQPAAAVCLSAAVLPSGCFGRKGGSEDGKREEKRMSVHPVCVRAETEREKKKGVWSLFENSNQPIRRRRMKQRENRNRKKGKWKNSN